MVRPIWHWDRYVDQKDLWHGFRALADALRGVAVDREAFVALDQSTGGYWCLILRGQTVSLAWLRNRADRWDHVLRDGVLPSPVTGAELDLSAVGIGEATVELFRPWPDDGGDLPAVCGAVVRVPTFRHGLVLRLSHPARPPVNPSGTDGAVSRK